MEPATTVSSCAAFRVTGALGKDRTVMRNLLLIPVLVFALSIGFSTPARATTPTTGSGTFTVTFVSFTPLGHADGNSFSSVTYTETDTGILAGSCSSALTQVIHADGASNFTGSETCTGTVAGRPGSWIADFGGTGAADGSFEGAAVLSGTGNLHGTDTFLGHLTSTGANVTYTGQVHFDP